MENLTTYLDKVEKKLDFAKKLSFCVSSISENQFNKEDFFLLSNNTVIRTNKAFERKEGETIKGFILVVKLSFDGLRLLMKLKNNYISAINKESKRRNKIANEKANIELKADILEEVNFLNSL